MPGYDEKCKKVGSWWTHLNTFVTINVSRYLRAVVQKEDCSGLVECEVNRNHDKREYSQPQSEC